MPLNLIVSEVNKIHNSPHLVLWYIGPEGLKKEGVKFYKDNILNPVLSQNENARFCLVDLTAWGAFKKENRSINLSSSCSSVIDDFPGGRISCIKSSQLLNKIQCPEDEEIANHFRLALRRDFLQNLSKKFPHIGVQLGNIFSESNSIAKEWGFLDVAKAYSMIQYLEGCFLVDEIVSKAAAVHECSEIEIVFILPNDEYKYYQDESNFFQRDIEFLISRRCRHVDISQFNISVHFYSFQYGSDQKMRPYNTPGGVYKKSKLSFNNIADHINMAGATSLGDSCEANVRS